MLPTSPPPKAPPAALTATNQPAPVVAADAAPQTISHIGADAVVGAGFLNFLGASARFEVRPGANSAFLARIGYLRGAVIDDDSLRAASFGIGYRGFIGRGYVGVEAALLALSEKTNGNGPWDDWRPIGNLTTSLGVKLGAVDASLQIMYPLISLGLNVGVDFSTF